MTAENLNKREMQVRETRQRNGTGFLLNTLTSLTGIEFATIFTLMGIYRPEANIFALISASVGVVAVGPALWRLRQTITSTNEMYDIWKKQNDLLRNRSSSTLPTNLV